VSRGPRLTGAARAAERRRENLDIFLGVLGFFTALIFVATAIAEMRGEPALVRAVALAVMVSLVLVTLRIRKAMPRPGVPTAGTARKSGNSTRG
jgi:hypothetical protein